MAEIWGAAIGAAAGLYGASQQAGAAGDAANAAQGASAAATAEQRRQYDQTRQDMMPWLDAGRNALAQQQAFLAGDYGNAFASPDYLAAFEQGMKGLDRANAANLSLTSGGADADRIQFGQQLATQQLGNYWNRLAGLSGTGQTTAGQLGQFGQQYANQMGNNAWAAANARGTAYGQRADAYSQAAAGIGGAFNNWYQGNLANNPGGTGWYLSNNPGRG